MPLSVTFRETLSGFEARVPQPGTRPIIGECQCAGFGLMAPFVGMVLMVSSSDLPSLSWAVLAFTVVALVGYLLSRQAETHVSREGELLVVGPGLFGRRLWARWATPRRLFTGAFVRDRRQLVVRTQWGEDIVLCSVHDPNDAQVLARYLSQAVTA